MKTKIIIILKRYILFLMFVLLVTGVSAQLGTISGQLYETQSRKQISFATIKLFRQTDSVFVKGTVSNLEGCFSIEKLNPAYYYIQISSLGYESELVDSLYIESPKHAIQLKPILLNKKMFKLDEVVFVAQRSRGKSENTKTTYMVNKAMSNVAYNTVELLKFIPGVQFDFNKNIYLNGKSDVIVLVDGKRRDSEFLKQLPPELIDKIDIAPEGSIKYDANSGGVINIILKKKKIKGYGGSVAIDLPTSKSTIFMNPTCSFSYNKNKVSLFMNYIGSFHYFDIESTKNYETRNDHITRKIASELNQQNWNHRINLSLDYLLNDKNTVSIYSFFNPFKNQFVGHSLNQISDSSDFEFDQNENDRQKAYLWSIFYEHLFNKQSKFNFDLSYYNYSAKNSFTISDVNHLQSQISDSYPEKSLAYLKIDYSTIFKNKLQLEIGSKYSINNLNNDIDSEFGYRQNNWAAYSMLNYQYRKFETTLGLRSEIFKTNQNNRFNKTYYALLPHAVISYKINEKNKLKLLYKKSIRYPSIYNLSPVLTSLDLYLRMQGNINLKPINTDKIGIEYSTRAKSNYFALELFYQNIKNEVHQIVDFYNGTILMLTPRSINQKSEYGIQISGSFNLFKCLNLVPYFKIAEYKVSDNMFLSDKNMIGLNYSMSLSAILKLRYGFYASFMLQYNNAQKYIHNNTFSDALYFLSIDKTIGRNLKLGILTGISFAQAFTFFGNKIETDKFTYRQNDKIIFSQFPVFLKLAYSFSSGRKLKIRKNRNEIREIGGEKVF
ncbi:MAG: TonB-dependent receptor family protein [Bacteroidales bacterium]|nr:TonB-dependent receptor family protein [Bacteroidales bacterium]